MLKILSKWMVTSLIDSYIINANNLDDKNAKCAFMELHYYYNILK
jgi:hypothetical protein